MVGALQGESLSIVTSYGIAAATRTACFRHSCCQYGAATVSLCSFPDKRSRSVAAIAGGRCSGNALLGSVRRRVGSYTRRLWAGWRLVVWLKHESGKADGRKGFSAFFRRIFCFFSFFGESRFLLNVTCRGWIDSIWCS